MKNRYNMLVFEALRFFIENPHQEIHLREFSRKTKISLNSAQRFLSLFLDKDFITEERKANLRYFKANLESIVFKHIKKTYSLQILMESGLIDYLKNADFTFVTLFGSVARGEDDSKSDIDLVCIGGKQQNLYEFERRLKKEINTHFFSWAEWRKQKDKNKAFYQDVISQGINLIGEIPVAD